MEKRIDNYYEKKLIEKRQKLKSTIATLGEEEYLCTLLEEVDAALKRVETGSFGICEECHEAIEEDRLLANPLLRFCLDHLSPEEQHALEEDLKLASQIQGALLPPGAMQLYGWDLNYYYQPAGAVSGDFCDLVTNEHKRELFFFLGDVSGKGISASMLMSNLHAIFRSIIDAGLSINELISRANRIFCESTLPESYATLVCGRADSNGVIEIINAGHCLPIIARNGELTSVESMGFPLGVFCVSQYVSRTFHLSAGDTLLLYTDGLSEGIDKSYNEYGIERIHHILRNHHHVSPEDLLHVYLNDLQSFQEKQKQSDDLTIMVIKRME